MEIGINRRRLKDACLSECGKYRYLLWRRVRHDAHKCGQAPDDLDLNPVVFIMLNPSKADHEQDDPTIRKVTHFAKEWGHDSVLVCNLFAHRATKPSELRKTCDPSGPQNGDAIKWAIDFARDQPRNASAGSRIVGGWGNEGCDYPCQVRNLLNKLNEMQVELWRLGRTKKGQPRHPRPPSVPWNPVLVPYSPSRDSTRRADTLDLSGPDS